MRKVNVINQDYKFRDLLIKWRLYNKHNGKTNKCFEG